MYATFDEIVAAVKKSNEKRVLAVAGAAEEAVIRAAVEAHREGIATAVFTGNENDIRRIMREMGLDDNEFRIVHAEPGNEGQAAVDLVREGQANILMKGFIDTKVMLKPVVAKENGLRVGKDMSHIAFFQIPGHHKLLSVSDGGMMIYPTLEDKVSIIENGADTLHMMGYKLPQMAVLCGIEKVNPRMIETVDADALKQMNRRGEITGCVVEGPLSYDVAMDAEIAHHKGVDDVPACGDFDMLIVPNLVVGNVLGKCLILNAGALMAGVVVGAKAPVVLSSRGATAIEKFYSIALAALVASGRESAKLA